MKMKLKSGQHIFGNFFLEGKKMFVETLRIKGFYCYGMHVEKWGVLPFSSERNWYAVGYAKGEHIIYLKNQWLLPRAIIFELVRHNRHGRIFFLENEKNTQK